MSGLLGKQTIDVRNTSRSFGQTGSGSLSHQKIARNLMTPDEVGNMKRHECLVRIANMPVFKSKKYNSIKYPKLSLFNTIRNDFVHAPEGLGIKGSLFTRINKSLFVLFLSLFSKVENLLIATILSSFRASITDKGSLID